MTPPPSCTGCGRKDLPVRTFECDWPDGRMTVERHCDSCAAIWQPQLRALGATLRELGDATPRLSLVTPNGARRRGK
jgi:hypothetical protein